MTTFTFFKNKLQVLGMMASGLICLVDTSAQAQISDWIDVTDIYIKNARYEQNNGQYWEGTELEFNNAFNNAELSDKTYDVYQELSGLVSGKYRLSMQGFYRYGTAQTDFEKKDISTYNYAEMYAVSSFANYKQKLPRLGSETLNYELGGKCAAVSENPWSTKFYVPDNSESAYYWFMDGRYNVTFRNNVVVGDDGNLTIGIRKSKEVSGDWTCFTNWKLEYYNSIKTATEGNVVVNEVMSSNLDLMIDPSWNYGGYVEFYNPTDKAVTLATCYLSDDPENLTKWKIPNNSMFHLTPKGFATIWFDHNDQYCNTQANFKLDIDGGTLYLSDPDGKLILTQDYPEAIRRCTYARKTDGGDEWGWSGTITPGETNKGISFAQRQIDAPEVNLNGQVFDGQLNVKVYIPAGATLKYTTDGSVPTQQNGKTSSDGTFKVDKTTVFRFRLFRTGFLPSDVVTRSYISHRNEVLMNSGWGWGSSYQEIDFDFCAPIISIVTNNENIFGDDYGIFQRGNGNGRAGRGQADKCNWNMDWDRPVSFEYIPNGKEAALTQEVNMTAAGGWSRAWEPHSFKLKANKEYGLKYMPYMFFEDKPFNKNKTLQVRNGGNDYTCRFIDPALQTIVARSNFNIDLQSYVPAFVFINGEYYSMLNIREPNNKHWAYANRGLDDDEMDQFEMSPDSNYVQMEGTKSMFNKWYSLAKTANDPASYEEIKTIVDIDEYINYMALEFFFAGNDWPNNNIKGYRPKKEGGKFRFVLFDLDAAFNYSNPFAEFAKKQTFTFATLYGDGIEGKTKKGEIQFVTIFLNMLENDEFRKQFIDTYCIITGSIFEPNRCNDIINELQEKANAIMGQTGESCNSSANNLKNKFTSARQTSTIKTLKNYQKMQLTNVNSITATLSSNLDGAQILINGIPVPTPEFSGELFPPIKVKAQAPAGYKFKGWMSGNKVVSKDEEYQLQEETTTNQTLVATYEKVAGGNTIPVRINEVSASNTMASNDLFKHEDWIELYNTTDEVIDIAGMYISDKKKDPLKYQFVKSDNVSTLIQPHGFIIVWCDKSDAVSQLHTNFKLGNDNESYVILTAEDGTWADTLRYNAHDEEMSYGRYPDGSDNVYLMNMPTAGKSNLLCTSDTVMFKDNVPTYDVGIEAIEWSTINNQQPTDDNATYNLAGQQVGADYKGIIIRKGKKYLVK